MAKLCVEELCATKLYVKELCVCVTKLCVCDQVVCVCDKVLCVEEVCVYPAIYMQETYYRSIQRLSSAELSA